MVSLLSRAEAGYRPHDNRPALGGCRVCHGPRLACCGSGSGSAVVAAGAGEAAGVAAGAAALSAAAAAAAVTPELVLLQPMCLRGCCCCGCIDVLHVDSCAAICYKIQNSSVGRPVRILTLKYPTQ